MAGAQPTLIVEHYNYVDLAHICQSGLAHGSSNYRRPQFNCYAVVAECSQPRPTRGTDMVINLVLVDPSLGLDHDSHDGVEMLCFARDANSLPRPRRLGDIIRLHRVEAQSFNMRPQLLGKIFLQGERRQGMGSCAFTLFDGASGGSEHPYQSSHPTYGWDDREPGLLAAMRAFVAERGRAHLTGGGEWLRRIKDVRPALFFDVVSLVVASDTSDPMLRVLWIWDNSDVVPLTLGADTRDEESTGRQEPAELAALRASLAPLPLPLADMEDGLARVPKLGTALPVVLQAGTAMQSWPAPGTWVKFRNLGARAVQGQLQAYYHSRSKWMVWEEDADIMREHADRVAANFVAGWAPRHCEEFLAVSSHPRQPFATLRQVLMDTPLREPRYYRVLVRVMDYTPRDPCQLTHPAAECGLGPASGYPHPHVYTLQLLLEDATAQLDACLFGPAADAFFGAPAANLRRDADARAMLLAKMDKLLGAGCTRAGGPWVELCLKSHYTDPEQPWASRQYLIEDSRLQEPAPLPPPGAA